MTLEGYFIYVLSVVLSFVIFYYLVKAAVRNGIREAREDNKGELTSRESYKEMPANPQQQELQSRYDNGEISFEEYQSEWQRVGR